MVTMSTFVSASISKNVYLVIVYMCAKFGAFIKSAQFFCLAASLLTIAVAVLFYVYMPICVSYVFNVTNMHSFSDSNEYSLSLSVFHE